MSDVLVGSGYGRTVGLRGAADALEAAAPALPFWWVESQDAPDKIFDLNSPEAVPFIVGALELWVGANAVDLVFVHAAVVAVDNEAILLPGRSRSGKSTLCAELISNGAAYLSDEYAVLDATGRVHPYPRPLQLRDGDDAQQPTTVPSLGARTQEESLEVGAVAFIDYGGDVAYDVAAVDHGTAVLRMLDNTLCAQDRPVEALDSILAALRPAVVVAGKRGPAASATDPLLALLRERRR